MNKEKLLAYLQLFRLPNVFTAISNIVMGYLFTKFIRGEPLTGVWFTYLISLMLSSSCLYIGGMVLNDVYDFDVDSQDRPHRPLPSGRINLAWAKKLGFGLLAVGVFLAAFPEIGSFAPRSAIISVLLAMAIYLYDSVAKQTAIAPILMGSCRTLNILLGMSCAPALETDQLLIALGIGIYVAGITWFARCEAKTSSRNMLTFGVAVMLVGIAVLSCWPWFSERNTLLVAKWVWPTLLVLLVTSVVRRCTLAISNPEPTNVQNAVKHSIFSLVVLDAAVVLATVGPYPALFVLALLIPTMFLGKWIYST